MNDKSSGKRPNLGAVMFSDNDPSGIIKAILNYPPRKKGAEKQKSAQT